MKGGLKELLKFKEREVHMHAPREEAMQDPDGNVVKTRWVQSVKGEEVRVSGSGICKGCSS